MTYEFIMILSVLTSNGVTEVREPVEVKAEDYRQAFKVCEDTATINVLDTMNNPYYKIINASCHNEIDLLSKGE